jgi:hypothetical protein
MIKAAKRCHLELSTAPDSCSFKTLDVWVLLLHQLQPVPATIHVAGFVNYIGRQIRSCFINRRAVVAEKSSSAARYLGWAVTDDLLLPGTWAMPIMHAGSHHP